jgi:hypothetical protein
MLKAPLTKQSPIQKTEHLLLVAKNIIGLANIMRSVHYVSNDSLATNVRRLADAARMKLRPAYCVGGIGKSIVKCSAGQLNDF